jgi:inosine/xanthosine triphosphatase
MFDPTMAFSTSLAPENGEDRVLRVAVGSENPAKIRAVEQALRQSLVPSSKRPMRHVVTLDVQGFTVASGVSDQPFGDDETCQGAKNRSRAAYVEYRRLNGKYPHMAFGMEGGLDWRIATRLLSTSETEKKDLYCMAWMCIYGRREPFTVDAFASADTSVYYGDKKPIFGLSKTASFPLPTRIVELVKQGVELGDADDQIFGRVNSKHGSGTVGIVTDGLIDRAHYYEHALVMALAPWIRPDLYPEGLS